MRNPIKELMGIKDSINNVKGTMDEIKTMLDDVKGDVDQVQQKLQGTMEHAKSTSEKAKLSADQLKQALGEASAGLGASKQHMQSTKKDIQQTATVIKGLFGNVSRNDSPALAAGKQESASSSSSSIVADSNTSSWLQDVEGAQLIKEGPAYFVKRGDQIIGEITYIPGPENDTWTLNHTYVDPQFRGGRIAKGLLDEVVHAARLEGKKIFPTCSYALVQFKRDRSYDDVWLRTS